MSRKDVPTSARRTHTLSACSPRMRTGSISGKGSEKSNAEFEDVEKVLINDLSLNLDTVQLLERFPSSKRIKEGEFFSTHRFEGYNIPCPM